MLMAGWVIGGKKVSTKEKRWYKDVGLGFKTPAEAIHGSYIGTSYTLVLIVYANLCVCLASARQEVPIHWRCLHSRQYFDWTRCLDQNDQHDYYPPRLPSLHPQIQ